MLLRHLGAVLLERCKSAAIGGRYAPAALRDGRRKLSRLCVGPETERRRPVSRRVGQRSNTRRAKDLRAAVSGIVSRGVSLWCRCLAVSAVGARLWTGACRALWPPLVSISRPSSLRRPEPALYPRDRYGSTSPRHCEPRIGPRKAAPQRYRSRGILVVHVEAGYRLPSRTSAEALSTHF